ncbi:MAG: hypothetical protein AAF721_42005 [Myxococcota bacterium]
MSRDKGGELELAAASAVAPVAHTWSVALSPEAALGVIAGQGALVPGAIRSADWDSPDLDDDDTYVHTDDDGLVLWRTPPRTLATRWSTLGTPWPKVLCLSVEPSVGGSRVVARWQRHPSRRRANVVTVLGLAIASAAIAGVIYNPGAWLAMLFWVLTYAFVPLSRYFGLRRQERAIEAAAHRALAPHEAVPDRGASAAFRRGAPRTSA